MATKTQFLPYAHRYQDATTGLREALSGIQAGIAQRGELRIKEADQKLRQDEMDRRAGQRSFLANYQPTLSEDHLTNEGLERYNSLIEHNQDRLAAMDDNERETVRQKLLRETADANRVARTVREDIMGSGFFDPTDADILATSYGSGYTDFAAASKTAYDTEAAYAMGRAEMFKNATYGLGKVFGGGTPGTSTDTGAGFSKEYAFLAGLPDETSGRRPNFDGDYNSHKHSLPKRLDLYFHNDPDKDRKIGLLQNRGLVTYQKNALTQEIVDDFVKVATDNGTLGALDNRAIKRNVTEALKTYYDQLDKTGGDGSGRVAAPPPEVLRRVLFDGVKPNGLLTDRTNFNAEGLLTSSAVGKLGKLFEAAHDEYLQGRGSELQSLLTKMGEDRFDFYNTPYANLNQEFYGEAPTLNIQQRMTLTGRTGTGGPYGTVTAGGEAAYQPSVAAQTVAAPAQTANAAPPNNSRGMRNNNPGNIEAGVGFQGEVGSDGRFAQFATPELGYRALAKNLMTYQNKHGLDTVEGILDRWAPPKENDTKGYVAFVRKALGTAPNEKIDFSNPEVLTTFVRSISQMETGAVHEPDVVTAGVEMALGTRETSNTTTANSVPAVAQNVGLQSGVGQQQGHPATEHLRALLNTYPQPYTEKSFTYDKVDAAFRRLGLTVPAAEKVQANLTPVAAGVGYFPRVQTATTTPAAQPAPAPTPTPAVTVADQESEEELLDRQLRRMDMDFLARREANLTGGDYDTIRARLAAEQSAKELAQLQANARTSMDAAKAEIEKNDRKALREYYANQPVQGEFSDIFWRAGPGEVPINFGPFVKMRHLPTDRNIDPPVHEGPGTARSAWEQAMSELFPSTQNTTIGPPQTAAPKNRFSPPMLPEPVKSLPERREESSNNFLMLRQDRQQELRDLIESRTNQGITGGQQPEQETALETAGASERYEMLADIIREFQQGVGNNRRMTLGNIA